ncbi:vacuolar SNARE Vam7 [Schizosaccharomyces japonicus yFS275]|uniref:Vacuolar SNARE Vam7 n=1 Tax=Schizosaccharomyces japonicus (strain yFS275 / FY16936) TaxID=402676 RepID=B6K0D1_SCHJY|nr:vacuolar SNARE Vam7 [Schizosaccharomyces japonicus yFS275]EEB06281.1 vacuolar SNARE Vam7 [Schizosaccharomyces japonicus yFS275]
MKVTIPTTSSSSDLRAPWTWYHILIEYPNGRKMTVKRRYREFCELHETLEKQSSQFDTAVPPIPPKSWFSSTVTNSSLRESRRLQLEEFLGRLVYSDWFHLQVVKDFLELREPSQMEFVTPQSIQPQYWLILYEETKRTVHELRVAVLSRRTMTPAEERSTLYKLKKNIQLLATSLSGSESVSSLGPGEIQRRNDLVGKLDCDIDYLQAEIRSQGGTSIEVSSPWNSSGEYSSPQRNQLFKSSRRVLGKSSSTSLPAEQQRLDNHGLYAQQMKTMDTQDQQVESLLPLIQRQKELSMAICNEVEQQNDMLDEVSAYTGHTQHKLQKTRGRLRRLE